MLDDNRELALALEEAALWHDRMSENADATLHSEFQSWLAGGRLRGEAYRLVSEALTLATAGRETADLQSLRRETSQRTMIVPRGNVRRYSVAAGLLALVSVPALLVWQLYSRPTEYVRAETYETERGGRVNVTLADGSVVTLNSRSRVRAVLSGSERRLTLDRGEAIFAVAKDPTRPFIVTAAKQAIVAHGTLFNVRLLDRRMSVTLVQGSVEVRPTQANGSNPVRMAPGQMLSVTDDVTTLKTLKNPASAMSWREGVVLFDDVALEDAVAEMNQYAGVPIRVDADLGRLRLSGSFQTDQTDAFVEALQQYFHVAVYRGSDTIVIHAGNNLGKK